MNTLPVWWVPPLMLLKSKLTKTPISGRPFETVPVVRVADLDALREGLEKIHGQAHGGALLGGNDACQACGSITAQVRGLLAMLPPREPSVPYPEWCRHKDQCAGRVSCPDDPTCAD